MISYAIVLFNAFISFITGENTPLLKIFGEGFGIGENVLAEIVNAIADYLQ